MEELYEAAKAALALHEEISNQAISIDRNRIAVPPSMLDVDLRQKLTHIVSLSGDCDSQIQHSARESLDNYERVMADARREKGYISIANVPFRFWMTPHLQSLVSMIQFG